MTNWPVLTHPCSFTCSNQEFFLPCQRGTSRLRYFRDRLPENVEAAVILRYGPFNWRLKGTFWNRSRRRIDLTKLIDCDAQQGLANALGTSPLRLRAKAPGPWTPSAGVGDANIPSGNSLSGLICWGAKKTHSFWGRQGGAAPFEFVRDPGANDAAEEERGYFHAFQPPRQSKSGRKHL